jgi:hypothetical protein
MTGGAARCCQLAQWRVPPTDEASQATRSPVDIDAVELHGPLDAPSSVPGAHSPDSSCRMGGPQALELPLRGGTELGLHVVRPIAPWDDALPSKLSRPTRRLRPSLQPAVPWFPDPWFADPCEARMRPAHWPAERPSTPGRRRGG